MNIGALIFIRSDSRRLPRKTFLPLGNKPLYQWTLDALHSLPLSKIIVATSDESTDDQLSEVLAQKKVQVFRGSKNDIAQRAIQCCKTNQLDYFFRVNGDSPFLNIPLLKEGLKQCAEGVEFVTNLNPRTYPYGISCELIQLKRFEEAYLDFSTQQKTHITTYYYEHLDTLNYKSCAPLESNLSDIRMTIDTPEDYAKMQYYLSQSTLKDFNHLPIDNLVKDYKETIDDKFIFHTA